MYLMVVKATHVEVVYGFSYVLGGAFILYPFTISPLFVQLSFKARRFGNRVPGY